METKSIAEILASLILRGDVSMKTIAIAGEAITADAHLLGHGQGPKKSKDNLPKFLETYEALSKQMLTVSEEFSETKDQQSLIDGVSEIKQALTDLY